MIAFNCISFCFFFLSFRMLLLWSSCAKWTTPRRVKRFFMARIQKPHFLMWYLVRKQRNYRRRQWSMSYSFVIWLIWPRVPSVRPLYSHSFLFSLPLSSCIMLPFCLMMWCAFGVFNSMSQGQRERHILSHVGYIILSGRVQESEFKYTQFLYILD